ncbi:MAG: hypothetical protein OXN86_08400 [Chloroflexota bacterium]|nr:hypothetical protein [Chloroflexota bacterium]
MGQRKTVTREMANRYRRASNRQKGGDARRVRRSARLPAITPGGCCMWGKTVCERRDGELIKIVVGQRRSQRRSRRIYDEQVARLTKGLVPVRLCGWVHSQWV